MEWTDPQTDFHGHLTLFNLYCIYHASKKVTTEQIPCPTCWDAYRTHDHFKFGSALHDLYVKHDGDQTKVALQLTVQHLITHLQVSKHTITRFVKQTRADQAVQNKNAIRKAAERIIKAVAATLADRQLAPLDKHIVMSDNAAYADSMYILPLRGAPTFHPPVPEAATAQRVLEKLHNQLVDWRLDLSKETQQQGREKSLEEFDLDVQVNKVMGYVL